MKNILNYETKSEFQADGNTFPQSYWLRKDESPSTYKEDYIPSRGYSPEGEEYGPFNFKGMVDSVFPGVAYIRECGMTIYNNTKFPLIDLTTKEAGTLYQWEDFGITEDIYQAYMNEVSNMNPVVSLNIKFPNDAVAKKISIVNANVLIKDTDGDYIFRIYSNGTAKYTRNLG